MRLFHTADWHLGKLVQGVYMTDDQRYVLDQFIEAVRLEKSDAVIIAGDLYDRSVPPTDAVDLLNEVLETIVLKLKTPVLAIAGNHDSPGRLDFGSRIMKANGLHIVGQWSQELEPIKLADSHGEVHFHLVPYAEPGIIRHVFDDDNIKTHNDAMKAMIGSIQEKMDPAARHVLVGHAFVTPKGEEQENTSDSERPLSIGGAEHVDHRLFEPFHYVAEGHLHQAHYVGEEWIRYAGSPMKYSISEEHHQKGYYTVDLDSEGKITVEKRQLSPRRDVRTVEGTIAEIEQHEINEDYVFVRLLDEAPVLAPMEKIRAVYPNAMHVEREVAAFSTDQAGIQTMERKKMSPSDLFKSFYQEVKGNELSTESEELFAKVLEETAASEGEHA
ncbi:MAG TPA: exonuclease SbcCD subunit D [Bacillales bacterium]|nr:exonuclease SbcCD subunit D [Bacillales bacterium]